MTALRRGVGVALALAALVAVVGCGDDSGTAAAAGAEGPVAELDAEFVPARMLDLAVEPEPLSDAVTEVRRSYLGAVRLFSLRKGELLQATLQVGRFRTGADHSDAGFRRALLNQIGGSEPQAVRLGDKTVYLTTGVKQRVAVWFDESYLFILGTREEFDRPRGLLREALEIRP